MASGSPNGVRNSPAADGVPAAPAPEESADSGPKASSYPVGTAEDLARVCDRWYYPQSPPHKGAAPHPISISVKDGKVLDHRNSKEFFGVPDGAKASAERGWVPKSPAAVQLVACVDLVSTGRPIKNCDFDDPKPEKVPMKQGIYQLSLYEVATGRKITQKRLTGEGEDCPTLVLLGADRTIHSEVNDRQFVETLRRYVEK